MPLARISAYERTPTHGMGRRPRDRRRCDRAPRLQQLLHEAL